MWDWVVQSNCPEPSDVASPGACRESGVVLVAFLDKPGSIREERKITTQNDMRSEPSHRFRHDSVHQIADERVEGGFALCRRSLIKRRKNPTRFQKIH